MAENQIIRHGTIFPRRPARDRLSKPVPQLLFCLPCIQRSLEDWLLRAPEPGFWWLFEITCVQDADIANDCQGCHVSERDCEMVMFDLRIIHNLTNYMLSL